MRMLKGTIARNLTALRQIHKYSQEGCGGRIGVSRQAVAKWESGESVPDIVNCDALAQLYDVELNDLIHHDQGETGMMIPPQGQAHIWHGPRGGTRTDCPSEGNQRSVQDQARRPAGRLGG